MGRVFTHNEIKGDYVPDLRSFQMVAARIRRVVNDTDAIKGALFCGSVGQGSWNRRSDIDCVVLYDYAKAENVHKTLQFLYDLGVQNDVPIEFIPVDDVMAKTRMHNFFPSFLAHLKRMPHEAVVKQNPCDVIVPHFTEPIEDVRDYIQKKLAYFEKRLSRTWHRDLEGRVRFQQKILEAPIHIARKILWMKNVEMPNDEKMTVVRHYMEIASSEEREIFLKLVKADKSYSDHLDELCACFIPSRYSWAMQYLNGEAAEDVRTFVRLAALRLS